METSCKTARRPPPLPWCVVGAKKVETKPPEGMEFKKYEPECTTTGGLCLTAATNPFEN